MKTDQIAHLYDEEGPFASAYVEVSREAEDGDRLAGLAARGVADQLVEQGAPPDVAALVAERVAEPTHRPAPVSRFVVATARGVVLDEVVARHRPQPSATWGPLPDVAPWIGDVDLSVPFVLALVDHEGGSVSRYTIDAAEAEEEALAGGHTSFVHKTPGGGWSYLRHQHHVENVWRRNATEVAAEIERQTVEGVELVVLAGDPTSRRQVADLLPDPFVGHDVRHGVEVVELEAGGRGADGGGEALEASVTEALREKVVAGKLAQVHELRERMARDVAVAVGIDDVADAFVRGQVERLFLDPESSAGRSVEVARHPGLVLGALTDPPPTLWADQAFVAASALTGADVVVSPASTLGGAPVAALLRWDQTALGVGA